MKTTLFVAVIVSALLIESCGSTKNASTSSGESEEKYYSRHLTPVIDGKMNEWGETLMFDNSTKCIYSIANDDVALYIAIKAADRTQQMKIVQGGMEIWIDYTAKKKKSTGIKFPLGGGRMAMPAGGSNRQDPKEMRQQMKLNMQTMELVGFKEDLNGSHNVYSTIQVKPAIEWDDKDNMVYELAIPFAVLDEAVRANLATISIGIFVKGIKMEQGFGDRPAGGPPGGRMPGGGAPGGSRPGGGMPDQAQMENMSKDNSFWTKYTLAQK